MATSHFNNVKICGIKTVIPSNHVDISDEIEYFDNNPKKLARAQKMMGYGRRYLVDENTTVTDLAVDAAEKLIDEMKINRDDIELLIFVNQSPDYPEPSDAHIAHDKLNLNKNNAAFAMSLGCTGYVYALWVAHAMIASEAVKNCLLLAGDVPTRKFSQSNRKLAPVFGDAASATFLAHCEEERKSTFVLGSDGKGYDKIMVHFGGMRLQHDQETINLAVTDASNNTWTSQEPLLKGEDVFNFTMNCAPQLIEDVLIASNLTKEQIDFFAIHQANKQIVENIIDISNIPKEKAPVETFSKYANNSTTSVATVLCDQLAGGDLKNVLLCTFGIGLSWAGTVVDLCAVYNGGVSIYGNADKFNNRDELIENWKKNIKGE